MSSRSNSPSERTAPVSVPIPIGIPIPASRRRSYQPPPTAPAALNGANWPPLSASYPPTPMAPRIHPIPLPGTPATFDPRELPSPAPSPPRLPHVPLHAPAPGAARHERASPRAAPAVAAHPNSPGAQLWPYAPPVQPIHAARPAASAPIPISGPRHPPALRVPHQRSAPPSSAPSPVPLTPTTPSRSPANTLLIPSPETQAILRRSHAPASLALNSPHPIMHAQHTYTTALHLLESMKFKYHPQIADHVRCSADPRAAAAQYGQYVRIDWESRLPAKIEEVLRLKYAQHPEIMRDLLETGHAWLVDEDDAAWNALGTALMRLRREYRRHNPESVG